MNGFDAIRDFLVAHGQVDGLPLVEGARQVAATQGVAPALVACVELAVNAASLSGDIEQQVVVMEAIAAGAKTLLAVSEAQKRGLSPYLVADRVEGPISGPMAGHA